MTDWKYNKEEGIYEDMMPDGENIVDLGCGRNKRGDLGVDIVDNEGVDVVHDLNDFPYPFDDNSFDGGVMIYSLEHLSEFSKALSEIHRILEDGSEFYFTLPHFTYAGAWKDPQHRRGYAIETLDYLERDDYNDTGGYDVLEVRINTSWGAKIGFFNKVFSKFGNFYENSFLCYLNPGRTIHALVEVV